MAGLHTRGTCSHRSGSRCSYECCRGVCNICRYDNPIVYGRRTGRDFVLRGCVSLVYLSLSFPAYLLSPPPTRLLFSFGLHPVSVSAFVSPSTPPHWFIHVASLMLTVTNHGASNSKRTVCCTSYAYIQAPTLRSGLATAFLEQKQQQQQRGEGEQRHHRPIWWKSTPLLRRLHAFD